MIFICLLRGVNVSGQKKIIMKELKLMFESMNFISVQTYIQSGNIIFESENKKKSELSILIKNEIRKTFGFDVPTFVESVNFFKELLHGNPYLKDAQKDSSKFHVTILNEQPNIQLEPTSDKSDEWKCLKNIIYLYCPNGYGRTKFTNTFFEKKLKVSATTRNWKTLSKLLELSSK